MGIYDEVFKSLEELGFLRKATRSLKAVVVEVKGGFIVYGEPKSPEETRDLNCLLVGARTLHGERAFIFPD